MCRRSAAATVPREHLQHQKVCSKDARRRCHPELRWTQPSNSIERAFNMTVQTERKANGRRLVFAKLASTYTRPWQAPSIAWQVVAESSALVNQISLLGRLFRQLPNAQIKGKPRCRRGAGGFLPVASSPARIRRIDPAVVLGFSTASVLPAFLASPVGSRAWQRTAGRSWPQEASPFQKKTSPSSRLCLSASVCLPPFPALQGTTALSSHLWPASSWSMFGSALLREPFHG